MTKSRIGKNKTGRGAIRGRWFDVKPAAVAAGKTVNWF
jgi:hypothetical protein